jgi:hypothetical protein
MEKPVVVLRFAADFKPDSWGEVRDTTPHAIEFLHFPRKFVVGRFVVPLVLAACGGDATNESAEIVALAPPADAIVRTTENGPVRVAVKVWPAKPSLADSIYLRLEASAPAGVNVDAPFQEAGDDRLGRFRVVGFTRDVAQNADGSRTEQQTYVLEAPTSGRQRVPPMRLEMTDARDHANPRKPEEILTDEVPLEIAPVPTEQATAALRAAAGPLDPDVGRTSALVVAAIAVGVATLGVAAAYFIRKARARRRVAAQRSAYDEAVAHLAALAGGGAPAAERADAWFVELSAIVRRYLEQRYEIRAPELTTEEFLLVATARPELTASHRRLLTTFLERCDRVKFAGYRPDAGESIASLDAARGFVEDTRLVEAATP